MNKIIILETERLYLRPYKKSDFASLHAIFSDVETMKYYPAPFSVQNTNDWIERSQDRYKNDGYGLWAVCLNQTNELIGDCGLVKQVINADINVEIGYHVNKKYWSNGFASEAAKACKEYGFNQLGLGKLISIIDPGNSASIRVAEKIGFTKEKEAFIFDKTHFIFSGKASDSHRFQSG